MRQHPFDEIRIGRDDAQCAHQFGLENVSKSAQEAEDFIMNHAGNKQASTQFCSFSEAAAYRES
jgi:hypothetical protein